MKVLVVLLTIVMISSLLLFSQEASAATVRSWASERLGDLSVGGQYSNFKTDLITRGHTILPGVPDGSLSGNLAGVDVFFWGTHTHILTAGEATALNNFVQGGGCVIIEANSISTEQVAANSGYNALGLGNRVDGATVNSVQFPNGGTFQNVVTTTTVGPLGGLRGQSFGTSVNPAIISTGNTIIGVTNDQVTSWVGFNVGNGKVLGVGDPYGSDFFVSGFLANPNNLNAYLNFVENCHPTTPVGGTIVPIDMTSLFVASAMTNASWVLPTLGGIAGAAIALFKIKRKHG